MARHFEITELRNAIRISVGQDLPLWARILVSFIPAVAALSIGYALLGGWVWLVAICIAAIAFATARGSRVDLNVTNVEFVTRGNIGRRGSKATQVVCTGDVLGLEFRDSTAQRTGLYALTARSQKCILPFVDYSESMQVIGAIQKKFPGLAESWKVGSDSSGHFLTVGLGKGKSA
jgi:hypothetical protein